MEEICFEFKGKKGSSMIQMYVKAGKKHALVMLSPVFPPFDDMLGFLENVQKEKEAAFEIDEEGKIKEFLVKNKKEGIRFVIRDGLKQEKIFIECDCSKKQFLSEIATKLKAFLGTDFDEKAWKALKAKVPYERIEKLAGIVNT
jgi:hypothetical protein